MASAFVHRRHESAISVPVLLYFLPPGLGVGRRFFVYIVGPCWSLLYCLEKTQILTTDGHGWTRIRFRQDGEMQSEPQSLEPHESFSFSASDGEKVAKPDEVFVGPGRGVESTADHAKYVKLTGLG